MKMNLSGDLAKQLYYLEQHFGEEIMIVTPRGKFTITFEPTPIEDQPREAQIIEGMNTPTKGVN